MTFKSLIANRMTTLCSHLDYALFLLCFKVIKQILRKIYISFQAKRKKVSFPLSESECESAPWRINTSDLQTVLPSLSLANVSIKVRPRRTEAPLWQRENEHLPSGADTTNKGSIVFKKQTGTRTGPGSSPTPFNENGSTFSYLFGEQLGFIIIMWDISNL